MSQAGLRATGGGGTGDIVTLTGNSGGAVSPDGAGNISLIGQGGVLFTGNPGLNLLNVTNSSALPSVSVTLTSQQVKNLVETPIIILAAQGPGTVINVFSCTAKLTYGGTNPFIVGGGFLVLNYGTSLAGDITYPTNNFMGGGSIDQSVNTYNFSTIGDGVAVVPGAQAENTAIYLVNGSGSDFTGNAANDNTVTVNIQYIVLTL